MRYRVRGVALGIAGFFLWFMPLVEVGINVYQTGDEIGMIAYPLEASSLAYAVLSCFELHKLRIVAASFSTSFSLLFLIEAGRNATWSLYALIVISGISWIVGYTDGERGNDRAEEGDR